MSEHVTPTFTFLGMVFDISNIIMILISSLVVFLLLFFASRNMTNKTPGGMQNFLEYVVDFIRGIGGQMMDKKTMERFVTLGVTLFLYIFIANQIGLVINVVTVHGQENASIGLSDVAITEALNAGGDGAHVSWWKSPTAAVSVPFAMAILVLFYSHWLGMRGNLGSYLKSYVRPTWLFLPLNIIEEASKFLSFPLRLYGNIFAGEVLLWMLLPAILMGGVAMVFSLPLIAWIGYSIFVGSIQAFIFTMLTMVYISHRLPDQSH